MPKNRETDVTGDIGTHLAATVLAPIATVEPRGETIELDYYCELREYAGHAFHVQAKGSASPTYSGGMISALPISRKTIEDYWMKQPYPVYILMSDTRAGRTYYIRVSDKSYVTGTTETYTFSIPLTNELTAESVGRLTQEILHHQPQLTPEEASELAAEFQRSHPLLCHDLDQIESFLEIMRGSDQHAQVQAKIAIQSLVKAGQLNSHRLESGLIAIFRNCKERITQNHVLDTFVAIQARGAAGEVIKQIDRNIRLYEYDWEHAGIRHTYIDFLFHGLARLRPTHLSDEVKRLIQHPDPNVLRGTLWLIGELKIRGLMDHIVSFLDHADESVRQQASRTLVALGQKNVQSVLVKLLQPCSAPRQLAAAINAMEQSRDFTEWVKVAGFKTHPSAHVRTAVASYLGTSQSAEHFEELLLLLQNDDGDVQAAAARSIRLLTAIPNSRKEGMILPCLAGAFRTGHELQAATFMGVLASCASEASREMLIHIYQQDDGLLENYESFDTYGNWLSSAFIDLKTQALGILRRFDISELYSDIAKSLQTCELDLLHRYHPF